MSRRPISRMRSRTAGRSTVTRMVEALVETPAARRAARSRTASTFCPARISRPAIWRSCATSWRRSALSPRSCPTFPARSMGTFRTISRRRRSAASPSRKSRAWAAPPGPSPSASRCAMRPMALEKKAGVPFRLFDRLTGPRAERRLHRLPRENQRQARAEQVPPPAEPASRRDARRAFLLRQQEDRGRRRARSALQRVELARRDGLHHRGGRHDDAVADPRKSARGRGADRRSRRPRKRAARAAI